MKFVWAIVLAAVVTTGVVAQDEKSASSDSLSKFDRFNQKAEKLFRILPVPMYSYSSDAGNIFGLAKFNVFSTDKSDTTLFPSKISGVFTVSSKGRINASIANDLIFKHNKYIFVSFVNYKKQPEYIFGIGNDVKREDAEQINQERFVFSSTALHRVKGKLYAGVNVLLATYFNIETEPESYLVVHNVPGLDGGTTLGIGPSVAREMRDNRYNPSKGSFLELGYSYNFGTFEFQRFRFDIRKYYKLFPVYRLILAGQFTTTYTSGEVPFYELSMLGGDNKMRGYYLGALRDKTAVDGQVELRAPVWNIFGVTAFVATGQVAPNYSKLSGDGFWLAYGGGVRIRVDSKNNTNLRFDMGFGPGGISGFYVNFAEAF
jgi:outer membrane protein assembly factor BamA